MTPETQAAINRMCETAASRLQREKYALTGLTRKQFVPCQRGLAYTAAMGTGKVMSEIWPSVVYTNCECHPDFTVDDCITYEHKEA